MTRKWYQENILKEQGRQHQKERGKATISRDQAWVETDVRRPIQAVSTQAVFGLRILWQMQNILSLWEPQNLITRVSLWCLLSSRLAFQFTLEKAGSSEVSYIYHISIDFWIIYILEATYSLLKADFKTELSFLASEIYSHTLQTT